MCYCIQTDFCLFNFLHASTIKRKVTEISTHHANTRLYTLFMSTLYQTSTLLKFCSVTMSFAHDNITPTAMYKIRYIAVSQK